MRTAARIVVVVVVATSAPVLAREVSLPILDTSSVRPRNNLTGGGEGVLGDVFKNYHLKLIRKLSLDLSCGFGVAGGGASSKNVT